MLLNNAVSAAAGFVPILGDVVLAAYKANTRNAALLEEFLRIRGEEFLKHDNDRTENPANVRPGAGRAEGEPVTGTETIPGKNVNGNGGWFKRRSKGKEVQTPPLTRQEPERRESRFIEDVPEGSSRAKKT